MALVVTDVELALAVYDPETLRAWPHKPVIEDGKELNVLLSERLNEEELPPEVLLKILFPPAVARG